MKLIATLECLLQNSRYPSGVLSILEFRFSMNFFFCVKFNLISSRLFTFQLRKKYYKSSSFASEKLVSLLIVL